jgi:hypothetical protein
MSHEELPLFVRWSKFLSWLLGVTEKFPKRVRFTFSSRLDNLAIGVLERIVEAAYSRDKSHILKQINLDIEKMRVLIRLSHEQQYISTAAYKHAIKELYETGAMTGGWIKEQKRK